MRRTLCLSNNWKHQPSLIVLEMEQRQETYTSCNPETTPSFGSEPAFWRPPYTILREERLVTTMYHYPIRSRDVYKLRKLRMGVMQCGSVEFPTELKSHCRSASSLTPHRTIVPSTRRFGTHPDQGRYLS